ncbi:MAG: phosphatidate cytidylyltransferase [Chitinophagaceae bacterium]|nr:phosphatidate cytidylyltransferase [Chitinophagaceae bacterium]
MAWNWKTFNTRALSAIVFAVIMLVGLLFNKWSFLILFTVIHFGCWREYQKLVGLIDKDYASINPFHKYGVMLAGFCLMLFLTHDWFVVADVSLYSIGWMTGLCCLFLLPISEILFSKQLHLKLIAYSLLGLIYISLSWALMLNIRSGALWMPDADDGGNGFAHLSTLLARISGYAVPLMLIGSIWINDTMAYVVGSLIGKTPLSSISPKKTWEGTIGGIILSVLVMWGIGYLSAPSGAWLWASIAFIAAVTGTFGDLLESKLKRMAGVKDSGNILPGHGGFLDRFDSLLLATPFVWLFLKIVE